MLDFNENRRLVYLALERGLASETDISKVKLDLVQTTFFSSLDLQGVELEHIIEQCTFKVLKNAVSHFTTQDVLFPVIGRLRKRAGNNLSISDMDTLDGHLKSTVIRMNQFDADPLNSKGYTLLAENDCVCMFMKSHLHTWLTEILELHHPMNKVEFLHGALMSLVPKKLIAASLPCFEVMTKTKGQHLYYIGQEASGFFLVTQGFVDVGSPHTGLGNGRRGDYHQG